MIQTNLFKFETREIAIPTDTYSVISLFAGVGGVDK